MFTKLFEASRQRAKSSAFNNGYDYAAGVLLRKESSVADLINKADTSRAFGESSVNRSFDDGVLAAIDRLIDLKVVDDPYVGLFGPSSVVDRPDQFIADYTNRITHITYEE